MKVLKEGLQLWQGHFQCPACDAILIIEQHDLGLENLSDSYELDVAFNCKCCYSDVIINKNDLPEEVLDRVENPKPLFAKKIIMP